MLRPFRRERVTFALPRSRLLAGVSLSDVALYSAERIFPWQSGNFVASDTFSHVVDLDEVAPFGTWDSEAWYNFVNGMVSADGWKYIQNHPASTNTYRLTLPKPQTLVGWTWDGNVLYNPTRQGRTDVRWRRSASSSASTCRRTANRCGSTFNRRARRRKSPFGTHSLTTFRTKRQNGVQIIGCDNIEFFAQRPADYRERVRPMLNSGGLVEYPRGQGGIVLVEPALPRYGRGARKRLEETQCAGGHLPQSWRTVRRRTGGDRGSTTGLHADRHLETRHRLPHGTRLVR